MFPVAGVAPRPTLPIVPTQSPASLTSPSHPLASLFWVLALATTITWASGHTSAPQVPGFFPFNFDKIAHFCIFGLLATLVIRLPWIWRHEKRRVWIAVLVVSLFGLSDELHQYTNPVRFFGLDDWLADTLGAITAVLVYTRWHAYRRIMEIRLFARSRRT